ncbi:MAG: arsenite methyltransferase [Chloroflexi bacterium]|nr:arsenite methyltransferase [Chloroflexota bacterium]MYK61390.1 arsenite methyltransferase [Chloroflexota bacterium]
MELAELLRVFGREEFDAGSVEQAVRDRYTQVAERGAAASGCCAEDVGSACCGDGGSEMATVADSLYESDDLAALTPEAMAASAGCGNPIGLSEAKSGETVLDLGSGGGIDCFLAAQEVDEDGQVIGIDMTHAMIDLARQNAEKLGVHNVVFKLGKIEAIPQLDASVDLVISNCVIALSPDKDRVFDEIYRVLKPGGRFVVSDMVVTDELPDDVRSSAEEWVSCVGGADLLSRYLGRMERSGFVDVEIMSDVPMRPRSDGTAWEESVRSVTVRGWKA